MLNKTLTMMFAVAAIVTNAAYAFTTGYHKYPTILRRLMQSEDDLFEAEEAAAFDATDIDDSGVEAAVMERAVMMAYDMMSKKKLELKEKVEDARSAEQQYYMMEEATKDLVKQYNEDPTQFKKKHSSSLNGAQIAIDMLESVIADAAQKMVDIENSQNMVISQFYETLEAEHMAEAKAAQETMKEEAANNRIFFIEEFNDSYEVEERRRDMAVSHAAHQTAQDEERIAKQASIDKEKLMDEEEKLERQLAEHKKNEDILKADLREIQNFVRDELLKEWEKQQQQQQQEQNYVD